MKNFKNILWATTVGAMLALSYALCGTALAVTIVGLPFAKQCFKMAKYFLMYPVNIEKNKAEIIKRDKVEPQQYLAA